MYKYANLEMLFFSAYFIFQISVNNLEKLCIILNKAKEQMQQL